jgi:DNA-binding MarR family transcriptional regulator
VTIAARGDDPRSWFDVRKDSPVRSNHAVIEQSAPGVLAMKAKVVPQAPEQFGHLAGRTIARLAKQIETAISPLELSLSQYRVLGFLADGSVMSSALAERMTVTPPTVTSLSDALVARGLVERLADPRDRRRLPLALTPDGEALLLKADALVGERLGALLDLLDDAGERNAAEHSVLSWQRALDARRAVSTQPVGGVPG